MSGDLNENCEYNPELRRAHRELVDGLAARGADRTAIGYRPLSRTWSTSPMSLRLGRFTWSPFSIAMTSSYSALAAAAIASRTCVSVISVVGPKRSM